MASISSRDARTFFMKGDCDNFHQIQGDLYHDPEYGDP